jgi:hypothetical protein
VFRAFEQNGKDFEEPAQTKLTMPMLVLGENKGRAADSETSSPKENRSPKIQRNASLLCSRLTRVSHKVS